MRAVRLCQIIAYSMVGHPLESLPVPLTQNIMSTCIIILRTGGCIWAFRRIVPLATKIVWGIAPPSKILWGRLPSLPTHSHHPPPSPPPPLPPPMALVYALYSTYVLQLYSYLRSKPHLPTICACAKIIRAGHPPFTNPGYATAYGNNLIPISVPSLSIGMPIYVLTFWV